MSENAKADREFKKCQEAYGKAARKFPDANSKRIKELGSRGVSAERKYFKSLEKLNRFRRKHPRL